jgi:heterodisulfide reductase subunit C
MRMTIGNVVVPVAKSGLLATVDEHSGQRIMSCYQCGKCTAGCPVAGVVALGPRQVIRAVQLGMREPALGNDMIWMCLSCQTCSVRCPREIDVAAVMEALRLLAVAQRVPSPVEDIAVFHRVFLGLVKRSGRVYELGLGALYNLLSKRPLTNATLLPKMLVRGKLPLMPTSVRGKADVKAIFERAEAIEAQSIGRLVEKSGATKDAIAETVVGSAMVAGSKGVAGRDKGAVE